MKTNNLVHRCASLSLALMMIALSPGAALADKDEDKAFLEQQRRALEEEDRAALEAQRLAVEAEGAMPEGGENAPRESGAQKSAPMLKGGVSYCVPRGTPLKLKLSTVPMHSPQGLGNMKLLERDMDGKLQPAQEGQILTAKTTEDIFVEDNKVIPSGTVFYGKVTKVIPPKRVGRPGSFVLAFDTFKLPDGRKFAFHVEANNTRPSTWKTKAKGFGLIAAHAAGGAAVGAIIAYQIFGLEETIAMHGYNIAGGAAAGALMGTAVALLRHGDVARLEPGEDLNMEIDTDLLLPAAEKPTIKPPSINVPGIDIKVMKSKMMKDGLDGHQLRVDFVVTNNTKKRLQSIDLFVEDDNGTRFPIVGDVETDKTEILFDIDPLTSRRVMCDFQYEYPKLKRKLVWVDHKSRQPIYEAKIP